MKHIVAVVAGLLLTFVGTSTAFAQTTYHVPGDFSTIQIAMNSNLVVDGDTIQVAAGPYNEHSLNPNGKAITIQGTLNSNGSLATTIDAQQGGIVFVIQSGETSDTVVKDLILTGGTSTESGNGGGIYCDSSSPTITGCTITNNTTADNWGGGGICCKNSNMTITNCTISDNNATGDVLAQGGGIYSFLNSNLTITGCTISGNTATFGGGIFCDPGNATIINCMILDNAATSSGGGGIVFNGNGGNFTIMGCTFSGNTSDTTSGEVGQLAGRGGGIACWSTTLSMTDCTMTGNTASASNGGGAIFCHATTPIVDIAVFTNNAPDTISGDFTTVTSTGACCYDGLCFSMDEAHCNSVGGTYADEPCSSDTQCPAACDHDSDNDGDVDIDDLLTLLSTYGICQ